MEEITYRCGVNTCGVAHKGTLSTLAKAEWFLPKGAHATNARCPQHAPAWVKEWRAKKAAKQAYWAKQKKEAKQQEVGNKLYKKSVKWELTATWPTAWDEGNGCYWLAKDKAFELGGSVTGGGVMTGAPLYNSPSNLSAVFESEKSSLSFVKWLRSYLEPRRHEDCDVRFYKLELKKVEFYDLGKL